MNTIRVDIDSILSTISKNPSISDLHLNCNEKSSYRINGEIFKDPNIPILNYESMEINSSQIKNVILPMREKMEQLTE